jgi:hypothetical protein
VTSASNALDRSTLPIAAYRIDHYYFYLLQIILLHLTLTVTSRAMSLQDLNAGNDVQTAIEKDYA